MAKNIKGADELIKKLAKTRQEYPAEIKKILAKIVLEMHSDTTKKIQQGARSGRQYKRGKNRTHTASAPGEFPKTDHGALVASLFYLIKGSKQKIEATFGSKAIHGKWLEFKPTSKGGRPWLKPQYEIFEKKAIEEIQKASKDIMKFIFNK